MRNVLMIAVAMVLLSGFVSGPITMNNATLGTAGETIQVVEGIYPINVTAYIKCTTGTIAVSGFNKGDRVSPLDSYGDGYATVDSVTTVNEGDIIPIVGKFTDIYWKGVGVAASGTIYIYKE